MNQVDLASASVRHAGVGETQLRLQYLRSPEADHDPQRLRAAARELEAYFLLVLMREMRKTVPENSMFHGGKTEKIFQDFLDEEISAEIARSGKLGLADLIYQGLEKTLKQGHTHADI